MLLLWQKPVIKDENHVLVRCIYKIVQVWQILWILLPPPTHQKLRVCAQWRNNWPRWPRERGGGHPRGAAFWRFVRRIFKSSPIYRRSTDKKLLEHKTIRLSNGRLTNQLWGGKRLGRGGKNPPGAAKKVVVKVVVRFFNATQKHLNTKDMNEW